VKERVIPETVGIAPKSCPAAVSRLPAWANATTANPSPDLAAVLGGLRSPDEQARVKALHAVCPCAAAALGPVAARLELVGGTAA
jgi:hypothetical protein